MYLLRVGRGRMPCVRRWNFDDMCHSLGDITTSGWLAAATLDLRHDVASAMIAGDL